MDPRFRGDDEKLPIKCHLRFFVPPAKIPILRNPLKASLEIAIFGGHTRPQYRGMPYFSMFARFAHPTFFGNF